MGLYILKLRKKFILLPSISSLDSSWYQSFRLLNIGKEDFFLFAFIAELKTIVDLEVSSCLS